jgi:gamma-glutamyltranspeptidase/glutathione hydrolase
MSARSRWQGPWLALALCAALALPVVTRAAPAAVASPDRYGADAAEDVLAAGGNAVDAAVAMAFTLAVTYPEAGNLGGGGFATVYFRGRPYFLDYRERAPAAASATMYLDPKGEVIPDASTIGVRAAGVPGTVLGLWELHRRFGALPWRRDLAHAIHVARDGFQVSDQLSQRRAEMLAQVSGRTNFARYFEPGQPDHVLRQPELAGTLERIAKDGPRDFYRGETARLLVAQMERDHGLVTADDLRSYRDRKSVV